MRSEGAGKRTRTRSRPEGLDGFGACAGLDGLLASRAKERHGSWAMAAPVGLSGSSSATLEAAGYPGSLSDRRAARFPLAGVRHRSLIAAFARPRTFLRALRDAKRAFVYLWLVFRRRAPTWRPTGDRSDSVRFPSVRAAKARAQGSGSAQPPHITKRHGSSPKHVGTQRAVSHSSATWQTATSLISKDSRFVRVTGTLLALTDKCVPGAPLRDAPY